jgi:Flp pilus assembly protein TadG
MEFALMLPFMLLLLLGVVEIGRAVFISIAVANGATAGVEYGAQSPTTAADNAGMQTAAQNDANVSGMTASATQGCRCDSGSGTSCSVPLPPSSSCATISCGSGQIVECVEVTTNATFNSLLHYPGLPSSYQASKTAVMRVRE